MEMHLHKITVYPIKSFDGVDIATSKTNKNGSLKFDRQFALFNGNGKTVNAKKYPEIIKLRCQFDLDKLKVKFSIDQEESEFELRTDNPFLNEFMSEYFKEKVFLKEDSTFGFPDDDERPGPTICSLESIRLVNTWFPDYSEDNIRKRFRANLELSGEGNGFWEEQYLNSTLQIGSLKLNLIKPCPRCPVPSRNPSNSEVHNGFQKEYENKRRSSEQNADKNFYPHYYMFGINTKQDLNKEMEISLKDVIE